MKEREKIFIKKKKKSHAVMPSSDRGGFPDFMRKEIFTQPELINALIQRYISAEKINFDYLKIKTEKIKRAYIVGNGENYGCVLAGAYNFEVLADVPCSALLLWEFNFSNPILDKNTLVIVVSGTRNSEQCRNALHRINESGAKAVGIFDYEPECSFAVNLDIFEKGAVSTAGCTLRYTALSLLALYFGEKNHVVTELYVKIAVKMLQSLSDKIKYVLESECLIKHMLEGISCENLILTGTNVDYAAAVYSAHILSFALNRNVRSLPVGELGAASEESNIIGFASNENFYHLITKFAPCRMKIVPKNIGASGEDILDYDDTIPLYNPILSMVISQLAAYNIAKKNGINTDKE